jgi:hypothetical protein
MNAGNGDTLPQLSSNSIPQSGAQNAAVIVGMPELNFGAGNPLPQTSSNTQPQIGFSIIALLFPNNPATPPTSSYST